MKKLILSCLTLLFAFSCGNKSENQNKSEEVSVIKIGVPEPLTGDLSLYGTSVKEGIELKVEEINNAGGINGKKIEIISADTKGDLQETVNIVKKMISEDKVTAILGEAISSNTFAAAELAQKAQVPLISPTGTRFDITTGKDFVFRTTFTDPFQGETLEKYIVKEGLKNVAILTNSSSDYSIGISEAFKQAALKDNLSFVEQKYTKDDKDFKSLLTNIKNSGADALVIPDYYNTVGLILSQAKELGLSIRTFGADGWDGLEKDFAEVAEGAIFISQFDSNDTNEAVVKFKDAYTKKFSKSPNLFAALGYDTVTVLVEALSKVENINDSNAIREQLSKINLDLITGKIEFDENRNPKKVVSVIEIKSGKTVFKEKF